MLSSAPTLVYEIGLRLLNNHTSKMLDVENAVNLESIFYACLECGRSDWGHVVLRMLKTHGENLPKSIRLEAILLNSEGKTQDAYSKLYSILKAAPADTACWKTLFSIKTVLLYKYIVKRRYKECIRGHPRVLN